MLDWSNAAVITVIAGNIFTNTHKIYSQINTKYSQIHTIYSQIHKIYSQNIFTDKHKIYTPYIHKIYSRIKTKYIQIKPNYIHKYSSNQFEFQLSMFVMLLCESSEGLLAMANGDFFLSTLVCASSYVSSKSLG